MLLMRVCDCGEAVGAPKAPLWYSLLRSLLPRVRTPDHPFVLRSWSTWKGLWFKNGPVTTNSPIVSDSRSIKALTGQGTFFAWKQSSRLQE